MIFYPDPPTILMHNWVLLFFSYLAQEDQEIGQGFPFNILLTSPAEESWKSFGAEDHVTSPAPGNVSTVIAVRETRLLPAVLVPYPPHRSSYLPENAV